MRILLIIALIVLFSSCKSKIVKLADYGKLDTRFVCSSEQYKDANLILKISDSEFRFNLEEFENNMTDRNYGEFKSELDKLKKHQSENTLDIYLTQFERGYITKNSDTIYAINSYGTSITLDELFKAGKFNLKSPKKIKCVEHRGWEPNYQGTIYSEWIMNKKIIKRIDLGYVN